MVRMALRGGLAIAVSVLAATVGAAPPDAAGRPQAADPQLEAVARDYAASLFNVIAHIEHKYIRPVATADLVEAALAGLYEAVRQPTPPNLGKDLQRMDDIERMTYIRRVRESL